MTDIRQRLMANDPYPDVLFYDASNLYAGSMGNDHYLRIGYSGTTDVSGFTEWPAYTQPNQYSSYSPISMYAAWFGGDVSLFVNEVKENYQWRVTSVSGLTYLDGTAVVGTWYYFSDPALTMRFRYIGGTGSYKIQVRRRGGTILYTRTLQFSE